MVQVIPPAEALYVMLPEGESACWFELTGDQNDFMTKVRMVVGFRRTGQQYHEDVPVPWDKFPPLFMDSLIYNMANASGLPEPLTDEWKQDSVDGNPDRQINWLLALTKQEAMVKLLPWLRDKLRPMIGPAWTAALKAFGVKIGAAEAPRVGWPTFKSALNGMATGTMRAAVVGDSIDVAMK